MPRKPPFPPEPETRPDSRKPKSSIARKSSPVPKDARERSEAPTMPPPKRRSDRPSGRPRRADRTSGVQSTKPAMPAATVDEVTADLSKDPRHERDDEPPPEET
jgi:hypothetical protein